MIYPDLIEKIKIENETFLIFQNGAIAVGYEIESIDLELKEENEVEDLLLNFVRSLSPKTRVRLILDSKTKCEKTEDSRSHSLQHLGYSENRSFLFFELETFWLKDEMKFLKSLFSKGDFVEKKLEELKSEIRLNEFRSIGLKISPISDYSGFFITSKISVHDRFITINDHPTGVLKLVPLFC